MTDSRCQMVQMFFQGHHRNAGDLVVVLKLVFFYPKMQERHLILFNKPHPNVANILFKPAVAGVETPTTRSRYLEALLWITQHC